MGEVMTMKEIERKYDQEWVLLGDPVVNADDEIVSATLLLHDTDGDRLYEQAMVVAPKSCAVLFMGPPKDGPVLML